MEEAGSQAIFVKTDVSNEGECFALAGAAAEHFGKIDVLINNAGVFANIVLKPFTELSSEEFKRVVEINTSGVFHCTKAVFPYMKEKGGKIINISSASIIEGVPGMPHYVASKGRGDGPHRCLARELGDFNIRIDAMPRASPIPREATSSNRSKVLPLPPLDELNFRDDA